MANAQGWKKQYLGQQGVCMDYPLVIACMIMDRFPSLDAANGQEECCALTDGFIPGSEPAVKLALETLRFAKVLGPARAVDYADKSWNTNDFRRANAGCIDEPCVGWTRTAIIPVFMDKASRWETPNYVETSYRV